MRRFILTLLLALAACTEPVYLRHSESGDVIQCGPYEKEGSGAHALQEAQCINDYKEQGYVRVPGPQ